MSDPTELADYLRTIASDWAEGAAEQLTAAADMLERQAKDEKDWALALRERRHAEAQRDALLKAIDTHRTSASSWETAEPRTPPVTPCSTTQEIYP